MSKRTLITVLILAAATVLAFALVFKSGGPFGQVSSQEEKFALPTWQTGDQWDYKFSGGSTCSLRVSGENPVETPSGEEVWYTLSEELDTPYEGWGENWELSIDSESLMLRSKRVWGYDNGNFKEKGWRYLYENEPDWPEKGDQFSLSYEVIIDKTVGISGESKGGGSYSVKIIAEGLEYVEVPAGNFQSLKLSIYNGNDLEEELWYSPEVKNYVKRVVYGQASEKSNYSILPGGGGFELVSYQVGDNN